MKMQYVARQVRNYTFRKFDSLFGKGPLEKEEFILVTGNQKSGTSVIASMLAAAYGDECTVDLFAKLGRYEYHLLDGRKDFSDFLEESKPYWSKKFVKEPEFILFFSELRSCFPDNPIVYIVRDPYTNIKSILERLGLTANDAEAVTSGDQVDFGAVPLWNLLFDKTRMPYGGGNGLEMLAQRWVYSVKIYEKNAAGTILVRYEDFLGDKVSCIEQTLGKLQLPVRNDISPLVNRQFQHKGSSMTVKDFFSSRQLAMINDVCRAELSKFDYSQID